MTTTTPTGRCRPGRRLLAIAAVLAVSLPLQSCFTTGLWISDLSDGGKASLTPLALTLDLVTLPAQLAIFEGHGHHHHRRCR